MRFLLQITLCCIFAGGAMAQRGGAGGGMHGGGGGGSHGGSSAGRGGVSGGIRGGAGFNGGFNSGFNHGSFNRGGFVSGFRGGFNRGFYGGYGYAYPYSGVGLGYYGGYWPGYNDFTYSDPYAYSYPTYQSYYQDYNPNPNVTVVYPPQTINGPVYQDRATPVTHEYDQYGQEVQRSAPGNSAPPIYLVAFKDHSIRAAVAYWVDGGTLHYVTLQHEEKQVGLDTVDREFSTQLNRERHISFNLPQ